MQRIDQRQFSEFSRRAGLGAYTDSDPNPRDIQPGVRSSQVFNPNMGTDGGYKLVKPTYYENVNSFACYPFSIQDASVQIIPANSKRTFLLVQNIGSGPDLWVNFSGGAGIGIGLLLVQGTGIIFDSIAPNNAIFCYYDNTTPEPGVIIEGALAF